MVYIWIESPYAQLQKARLLFSTLPYATLELAPDTASHDFCGSGKSISAMTRVALLQYASASSSREHYRLLATMFELIFGAAFALAMAWYTFWIDQYYRPLQFVWTDQYNWSMP